MGERRPPDAIQWHEGMLLSPQHFQQASLRAESLTEYHVSAANPFHWGIRRLRIDSSALVGGLLRVVDLEAVMPDGLLVQHPAEGAEDLQLDLAAHVEAMGERPVTIHLCVPARIQDGSSRGISERYRSVEGPPVLDENLLENEIRIPRLVPRLSLYAGESPPQRFVSFPLMEVAYRDEAFVQGDFMPPCLQVTRDLALSAACQTLAARLREKAAFLAERLGGSGPAGSVAAQENQRLVHRLVSALPPFEAMLATGVAHPYQLYLAVCQLTGQLAGLGQGQMPPVPAAYRHNDLRGCFRPLLSFLQQRLDSVQVSYRQIAFNREDNAFYVDLKPEWLDGYLLIAVRRRSSQGESEVQDWIENCLVCSAGKVQAMVERRVLGAARRRIEHDERLGVTPGRDTLLFAVEADPAFVDGSDMLVVLDRRRSRASDVPLELALYVPSAPAEEAASA